VIVPLHGFGHQLPVRRVTLARAKELWPEITRTFTDPEIMLLLDGLYGLAQVHVDATKQSPPVLEVHRGR
jgi:hypothetical protein